MNRTTTSSHLNLLKNHIDITRVPFSDRGSRLLLFRSPGRHRLYVRLAERLAGLQPGLEAYRTRPPFIQDLCLLDADGQPLAFEIETYPHAIHLRTRLGEFAIVFQDNRTLSIGLPACEAAGIRFHVLPEFWEATGQGGAFKAIRNLVYTSNAEIVCNDIEPQGGGYDVEFTVRANEDSAIALTVSNEIDLQPVVIPFSRAYRAAEARWHDWFEHLPPVDARYRQTYTYAWWIMANNLISPVGRVFYEAMMPSKITYVGLWLWDSAMHALAYRHVDPQLARNQILAMLRNQLPNGMMPDAVFDEGVIASIDHPITAEVTKPPILAWAALKLHETAPDINFLQEIYVPLGRVTSWWFGMSDDDADGLAQYNHPYSSGLDNSPLWDYGMPVESPDLNTYLALQMQSLAHIADLLGLEAEGNMWRLRAQALVRRMIQDFWDEDAGVFWALHQEKPVPVLTPFNLYPLWTGALPKPIRDRVIQHLTNPDEFWGDCVLPTVAYNDPHFDPDSMWRGPVWLNVNYFFIEALQKVGEPELARRLRDKSLDLVLDQPSIYEYYNARTGQPPVTAADIFGWTAAVFIDLAIQASNSDGRH